MRAQRRGKGLARLGGRYLLEKNICDSEVFFLDKAF